MDSYEDAVEVRHQQAVARLAAARAVIAERPEVVEVVRAWLDDDEELRIPDTPWGRSLYEALTALLRSVDAIGDGQISEEERRRIVEASADRTRQEYGELLASLEADEEVNGG